MIFECLHDNYQRIRAGIGMNPLFSDQLSDEIRQDLRAPNLILVSFRFLQLRFGFRTDNDRTHDGYERLYDVRQT